MKRLALALALALVFASSAHAQGDTLIYSTRAASWVGQFTVLSANTLISGVTGGLFQELRGGSFKDGFTRGALGGAVIYAGKRVAVERFFGAGFVGREVSAVGASMVRNASDGVGTFDRLILPLGFTRVYWNRAQNDVRVKLDLLSAGYTVYGVVEKELSFELRNSISAGLPVFRTDNKLLSYASGEQHAAGVSWAGVVIRADIPAYREDFLERAFAHERIHALQDDQIFVTMVDHADDWVLSKLGPLSPVSRFVDINPSTELLLVFTRWIPKHGDRPWEMEPNYLTR